MSDQLQVSANQHILVVDDQRANLDSLQMILKFNYQVSLASSGQACLDHLASATADLILLDVDMPMMDGLTVCRIIKANPATSEIPVIFVSALSRLSERLAGYRAGADDYISKPYDAEELLLKIRIALNNRYDLENAKQRSVLLREEMEESLALSTELEEIARFISSTLECDDVRSLGEQMLVTLERFGLRVIVRMIPNGHYFSHAGEVGILDQEMMESMYEKGHTVDFGHRTLINTESVSLLVRNMPIHDTDRYQRWKANVKLMAEVVNQRISDVQRLVDKQRERERLEHLISTLHQLIEAVQERGHEVVKDEVAAMVSRVLVSLESNQTV